MTISNDTIESGPYVGNGIAQNFDYDFQINNEDELVVLEMDTTGAVSTLTLNTDYTVTNVGDTDGGQVQLAEVLTDNHQLLIRLSLDETQETSFPSQGGFFPQVHESAFDKLTRLIQIISDRSTRALRYVGFGEEVYDAEDRRIVSVADPEQSQDSANRRFVESLVGVALNEGSFGGFRHWSYTGDGATATYSINEAHLADERAYLVYLDGQYQTPVADYVVDVAEEELTFFNNVSDDVEIDILQLGFGSTDAAIEAAEEALASANTAADSETIAGEHVITARRWAKLTGGTVTDESTGDDTGEFSSKEYAQGSMPPGGSAKGWAQSSSSPDGTTSKSAKGWASVAESFATGVPIKEISLTTHTLTDDDGGYILVFTHASGCLLTLPEQDTESIPAGFECGLRQSGGNVSVVTEGGYDPVNSLGQTTLGGDGALAYLYLETADDPNVWVLSGDTSEAQQWGSIGGTLADQEDLQQALDAKKDASESTDWGSIDGTLADQEDLQQALDAKIGNDGTTLPSILSDDIASRPSAGTTGRWFYADDQSRWYRDTGSEWETKGGHLEKVLLDKAFAQTIPDSTSTFVDWDGSAYDLGDFWNPSGDTDRLIMPRDGTVIFSAAIWWDTSGSGHRQISLLKGTGAGQQVTGGFASRLLPVTGTNTVMPATSAPLGVSEGDVFRVSVYQTSGGGENVQTNSWFSAYYIE